MATAVPCGTWYSDPSAWPMAWAMPVPQLSIAMPASSAASCIAWRAARSSACATAAGRWASTSLIACSAAAVESGFRRCPVHASMACTKASSPVEAVTCGGIDAVAVGSRMTASGSISSPHVHTFLPCPSLRMHVRVTSAPVPDVVGTATIGRRPAKVFAPSR